MDTLARCWLTRHVRLEHAELVGGFFGDFLAHIPHLHDASLMEAQDVHDGLFGVCILSTQVRERRDAISAFDGLFDLE